MYLSRNMDSTAQNVWKEVMRKEAAFHKKWEKENETRYGEGSILNPGTVVAPNEEEAAAVQSKMMSSSRHFLDQKLGLVNSPHLAPSKAGREEIDKSKSDSRRPSTALLYFGVSKEGQGRQAYLKVRAAKGPQEKFGRPVTSASDVGWTAPTITSASGSPFAHKPLIKETFYRSSGVMNY